MSELDLERFEKALSDSKSDEYNNIGKLNLVAWIGERSGLLIEEIKRLRIQNAALTLFNQELLEKLEEVGEK